MACPRCGALATGNFCASCGGSLSPRTCPACGHTPAAGARFCNLCGARLAEEAARAPVPNSGAVGAAREGALGWWIAGTTLVALILLVAWPVIRQDEPDSGSSPGAAAPGATGGAPPDLSSMTPREAADRLFNRVMGAVETGDEATVQSFLPMALGAFERARPLDAHGLADYSMLYRAAGDFAAALAVAQEGLAEQSDHLLLLAAAAEAAEGLGDMATARPYWQRFLELHDAQRALGLEEYAAHEFVLERSREHARGIVGG